MTVSELIAELQKLDENSQRNLKVVVDATTDPSHYLAVLMDVEVKHLDYVYDPDRDPDQESPRYVYLS
jgi:hypothetical protein